MRILLVANFLGEGCTGLLVAQALSNIGHSVIFWDAGYQTKPPQSEYDFAIVWLNRLIPREIFKTEVAYIYLDDPSYWQKVYPEYLPENCARGYKYVFANIKWDGFDEKRYTWLPFGCLPQLHRFIDLNPSDKLKYGRDVVFIGTNRGKRGELVKYVYENLPAQYTFKVYGNDWKRGGEDIIPHSPPVYFEEFVRVLSASKIALSEHYCKGLSTNDCEKPAVGGAMLLTDCPLVKQEYPMCPIYTSPQEAIELAEYYLEHEDERLRIVKEMQEIAYKKFTYEEQLKKLIKICTGYQEDGGE
ncbi:MAG: glycosyltransferase [Candidatus Daviesbacteria bacterium]|nr:glycosyltransferase [Candidatus Daviesbacteria bacterium]